MDSSNKNRAALAVANPLAALYRDQLVNENAAAELLGITPQYLRCSRMQEPSWDGPPFVVVGKNAIRYRVGALLEFIESRTVDPAHRARRAS